MTSGMAGIASVARVAEAALALAIARVAIAIVPFRLLARAFERSPSRDMRDPVRRARAIMHVQRAVWQATRYLPGQTVCFPRAAAAQALLRRRGVATVLFYGASTTGGLRAHAWLQDGDAGIMGMQAATGYRVLARYPATD